MTNVYTVLGIIAYLAGSGVTFAVKGGTRLKGDDADAAVVFSIFWPLTVVLQVLSFCLIYPIDLVERYRRWRADRREGRARQNQQGTPVNLDNAQYGTGPYRSNPIRCADCQRKIGKYLP